MTSSARQCQTAVFDSLCFPSVKGIAATGSTMERKKWAFLVLYTSRLEDERKKEYLDSPGMAALLQNGLLNTSSSIAVGTTTTISRLCSDEATASAVLDNYPDLVQTLVGTFSTSGICTKFSGKSRPRSHPLPSFRII